MNANLLKLTFVVFALFGVMQLHAQDQTICPGEIENYSVDTDPTATGGDPADGPNGTPGSTYVWSVVEAGFAGTISANTASENDVDIDWGTTPSGTYTVQVIETGTGCPGIPVTMTVLVDTPAAAPTAVAVTDPVCSGDDAVFTITGLPDETVTYDINGGASQTVVLVDDGSGVGVATVTEPGITADTTINITQIENANGCPTDLSATPVSATVTVLAAITEPTVTVDNTEICVGDDAVFTITGDPGAVVTYSTDGGANTQTVTLDATTGTATVTVPTAAPATDVTIDITDVAVGTCSDTFSVSSTITVNPAPTTTPINFN